MGELGSRKFRLFGWVVRWQLWHLPRRVFLLVAAVHLATVASVLSTAWMFAVESRHWIFAAVLVGLGLMHLEHSRGIGPRSPSDRVPFNDLKTVWNVAAVLLVPPILATMVIIATHLYGYLRLHLRDSRKAHRWAYSCATVVLASQAAVLVLVAGMGTYPGVPGPTDVRAWLVVFAAVFVRWLVNYLLIILAVVLASSPKVFADVFARLGDQVNEAAATALAIVVAVLLDQGYSVLLVCVYLVVVVLQQTSYYHHWKRERPFDPVTGVYSRLSFLEQSKEILARAKIGGDSVGCLLLDLDFFKRINDTHGHNVGDKALAAVADAIKQEVREGKDIPARWGGEEFVVLVPGVTQDTLSKVAERIRLRVGRTEVTYSRKAPGTEAESTRTVTMTVSIGAALSPNLNGSTTEETLLDLVERADQLMYAAKAAGRNRVCTHTRLDA